MVLVPFTFMVNVPEAQAATITAYCDGTAASPVVPTDAPGGSELDEGSWTTSDDVTFLNGNNDGYCLLDKEINVASVTIGNGLADGSDYAFLTHAGAGWDNDPTAGFDMQGVLISTSGNFTIYAGNGINVDEKGCQGASGSNGFGPNEFNVCTVDTAGYGGGAAGVSLRSGSGAGHGGAGGDGDAALGPSYELNANGSTYGSSTVPVLFGSSSGGFTSTTGGDGGGLVKLVIGGGFTFNGSVSANGANGPGASNQGVGGGGGGSVDIAVTGALSGSTGALSADGGDGYDGAGYDGGGGGGGRIALTYGVNSFTSYGSGVFAVAGGAGPDDADEGGTGTVYTKNTGTNAVTTYHGFSFTGDYSATTWTTDSSVVSMYCDASIDATPSLTATNITFINVLDCSTEAITNFDLSSTGTVGFSSATISLPAAITMTLNEAAAVTMTGSTINGSVDWQNLASLSIDGTSAINANGKGCTGVGNGNGFGPSGSNVCSQSQVGSGYGHGYANSILSTQGAGHGGTGGDGAGGNLANDYGASYGSSTDPILFGSSSGGTANKAGASGGGLIILDSVGDIVVSGSLTANGSAGNGDSTESTGGGSGGSIKIVTAGAFSGTSGAITAIGGDGHDSSGTTTNGGGGGGGRIRVAYGADSSNYLSSLVASTVSAGGTGPDAATNGGDGSLSAVDLYGPSISSAATDDTDSDGYIDAVILTMTEDVETGTIAGADFTSSDSYTVASASRTADSQITVVLTEKSIGDTSVTPTITIAGSIDDTSANSTTSGSKAATDGAKPRITDINYSDQDADGKVDTLDLRFSENITAASVIRYADLSVDVDGDFDNLAFGGSTTDLVQGTVGSLEITLATPATVVDTNEGSGTLSVLSQVNFSITDGTNTNTDIGAFANVVYGDRTGPVITVLSPADAETNVSTSEDIVVTFSEAINTGTAAYTLSADPGGKVDAWTVGNTVLTVTHDQFESSTDYTFTMTVAADAAATAFGGAIAGVTHPATFTTASSGGVSVSSSAPDPSIGSGTDDNPVDSISESSSASGTCEEGFNPGENIALAWASNSSVNLVNLYYSTDAGITYTLIEGPITNTENYTWTIPADIAGSTLQFKIEGTDLAEITATFETESCALNGADDGTEDSTDNTIDEDPTSEVTEPTTGEQGYSPVTGEVEDISVTEIGDYIRSSYFSTVYYLDTDSSTGDMVRRPFMDAQTFFTYQDNFDNVKTVTDATLTTITLGHPMLPNPGVVLIKIQSDPKVYAIDSDGITIRWIASEEVANTLYGDNWNQYIIDVEATFFPRFTQGDDVDEADDLDLEGKVMKKRTELSQ